MKPTKSTSRIERWILPSAVAVAAFGMVALRVQAQAPVCVKTYTLNADFDEGTLLNLNHDSPDQLQLNKVTKPFPFVNIACSARGTAVRIDVNTGQVLGEYQTAPDGMGRNPSRTTVDRFGNVWVANRDEGGFAGTENKGSVVRIALVIGGTRCDSDGTPNPSGQYLKPPFAYSTAVDRDGDGLIKTSSGLGNILPWSNAGGADSFGGVSTADDECIINYTRVAGTGTRTIAIDANNDVWTGGLGDRDHEKISGVTGLPIPGTKFNVGCGGYGGLIDGNGVLWSASGGSSALLRYDTTTPIPPAAGSVYACLDDSHGDYGLGIDPVTGHIWHTKLAGNGVVELDSAGNVLNTYFHGNANAQGVAVDGSGNVWVAHSLFNATTVGHLRTDGTYVGNVVLPGGNGPTGVSVDANGKIWVANINSDNAMRIDPAAGPIGGGGFPIGAVDLTVPLGAGAGPYNYSDMTGFVSIGATTPSGTWTVLHDSGSLGTAWGTVCWNGLTPAGTAIKVEIRAADTQAALSSATFVEVQNCTSVCAQGIAGRFIEVRTTLSHDASTLESPILYDLTIKCCNQPPVALCQNVIVPAQADCSAWASVDAGSYDPDGDAITTSQDPPGPYPLGTTPVTLTVTDPSGAVSTCTATVTVVDTTAPVAECRPTTNPGGDTVPPAGRNPKSGQNPDGFYQLLGSDNCDAPMNLALYVADSGSSFVAGPFRSGSKVKLTQVPGGTPSSKPMAGAIVAHIQLKGDAVIYAVDSAGNRSLPHRCLVPPSPK